MLEGINVLNQEMIMLPDMFSAFTMFAVCLIASSAGLLVLIFYYDNNEILSTIGLIVMIVGLVCILVLVVAPPQVETGRYRYEVTVDESASFTDIYEKYEIVEQRGEIWVLEEKE